MTQIDPHPGVPDDGHKIVIKVDPRRHEGSVTIDGKEVVVLLDGFHVDLSNPVPVVHMSIEALNGLELDLDAAQLKPPPPFPQAPAAVTSSPCPECRDGKHVNCTSMVMASNDSMVACPCRRDRHRPDLPRLTGVARLLADPGFH